MVIPVSRPFLGGRELEYVSDCVKSNWVSSIGGYIGKFEQGFASFIGSRSGIATMNGTVGLHLALAAFGIGRGDEVIVPDLTFAASANSVIHSGAKPVLADISMKNWNLDPESVKKKITRKTKAIMPVHLYGAPCAMDELMEIAHKNDLLVIEDCAESHGSEYNGKKMGVFGDCGIYSFYGNKIMTCGEGGLIVTDNREAEEKMRILRDHGMSQSKRYWHDYVGYNYRMTNMQAALGLAQLENIEFLLSERKKIAKKYDSLLSGAKGIGLQEEQPNAKNVCWLYSVLVKKEFGEKRDEVIARLKEKGIDARPFFYPLHQMAPYKCTGKFPVSTEISGEGISLPTFIGLTDGELNLVAETILALQK